MSAPHDSDLGLVHSSIFDQFEQKQIKEGQDFAQRLPNSQDPDQASESTPDSDSGALLLQEYDPVHVFLIIGLTSKLRNLFLDLPKT